MLLVIHNLPLNSKYADIKGLIQSKCGVTDVILDNLVNEGSTKKVTVGLADDGDGAILVRKINGIFVGGQQLYVEDVRQKKESEQPYRSSKSLLADPSSYNSFPQNNYQRDPVPQSQGVYQPDNNMGYQNQDMMMMNMAAVGGMYYMPNVAQSQAQTSYMGYGAGQAQMPPVPEVRAPLERPFGFGDRAEETPRDRPRQSYGDRRAPSPARGGRDRDRQSSAWNDQPDTRPYRRRSRSPHRNQWQSRGRSNDRDDYDNYQDDLMSRDLTALQNFHRPQQQMNSDNYNSNYGGNTFTPNTFGNNAMQDSGWQQPYDQYNQPDSNVRGRSDYQRSDYQNPRNDRNPSSRDSRPYERDSRVGPGQSRQSESWRDEPRLPAKRGSNRWEDNGPQAKRFAQPKDTQRGPQNARWADDGPRGAPNRSVNPNSGPRDSGNAPNRSGKPNFGPRGPGNAPNRSANPNSVPRGPGNAPNRSGNPNFGPRGQGNAPVRAGNPNFGPRGQGNAPARAGNPNAGPRGPSNAVNKPKPGFPNASPKGAPLNPKDKLTQGFNKTKNDAEPLEKLLNRDETWRGQAASSIAKEMLKKLQIQLGNSDKILTHLKQSIRARINVMLGDQISNRNDVIVNMYYQKFPSSGDQEFFSTVVNDLKAKEAEEAKNPKEGAAKPKPATPAATANNNTAAAAAKKPATQAAKPDVTAKTAAKKAKPQPTQPTASKGILPKYPEGDKLVNKRIKADERKAWQEDAFQLPEKEAKVLDEELDQLSDIFMSEATPDNEEEKAICEQISDVVSDEFRKIIRIHVTKRVTNDTKNLMCRVFCPLRAPQRPAVEAYLKKLGCTALQKSDRFGKMYMAHFDNYNNFDKVIRIGQAEIGGINVSFKPFQLCGPTPSAAVVRQQFMERKKKFLQSQIDKSTVNLLDPNYVYDPSEARKAAEKKHAKSGNTETKLGNTKIDESDQIDFTEDVELNSEVVDLGYDDDGNDVTVIEDDDNVETIDLDAEDDVENVDEEDLEDW
ncbi:hypothetical protein NE865_09088 [Phthorimaea operculella]|nr:hypothetical protein NE865_09088 [Phthorimaea operculella]